ncbi:MAG: hypothetical protein CTY37_00645 [Methylotenera sp.]|nr:MAG: hypothetical protein CTY37_00645 [Methylotenera sp.]PPD18606.1 MAG: hypothetical protein CTY27_01275 [Methylotenera sp.]
MAIIVPANNKTDSKRLGVMLMIALVLAVWVILKDDAEDADLVELVEPKRSIQVTPARLNTQNMTKKTAILSDAQTGSDSLILWQKLQRMPLTHKVDDVFKVHSWLVVPKVVNTKQPPPPPPVAPPAPFTYMGKLEDSPKGTQVFLMRGGKLFTAIKGQKIDAQWRLDSEEESILKLTYLPLNLPQILVKSSKSTELSAPIIAPVTEEVNL